MAPEHRHVMVFLCVCLASIYSTRAEDNGSITSNEQSEADYIRLEDLIRQQLLGLVQNNDFAVPNANFYPRSMSGGTQVRHLSPRSGRLHNFLFGGGSDDTQATQNSSSGSGMGAGGLLNRLKRRPSQQSNRVSGMSDYYDDGLYPQYIPSQNQNLMYDYLPSGNQYDYLPSSGNQLVYDGYNGRPNMMWNGGGIPSGYEYVNQPLRVPGRRMGVRPLPMESYDMGGNGGLMPTFDSVGSPGNYVIQIPSRGRRNNLNGGSPRPTTSPTTQIISPTSGSTMTIPNEVSNTEDTLNTGAGIPTRTSGRKNSQNLSMVPGSQIISSGNMGIPNSEALSTVLPSTQSYTINSDGTNLEIPSNMPGSGGSSISFRLPENMNGLRNSQSSTGFSVGSDGIELGGSEASNGLKIGRGGSLNSIELPIDANVQGLGTGGRVDNTQLPSSLGGFRAGLSGLTNNIKLPANLNGIRFRTEGSSDNIELPSSLDGLRVGSGKSSSNLELPIGGGVVRMGQIQMTLPSSESFSLGNGGLISTTEIPTDISNLPGSFSVSSGRGVQMIPSSVSESFQGQPTSISIDEADTQPDYDIDVRDLGESAYASGPMETLMADAQPMPQHTITQSISGPSESLDIMSPAVSNIVDQDDETTSLASDMNFVNGARNGRILGSPVRGAISQNGADSLVASGNTVNPKRTSMTQIGGYYLMPHQNDFVDTYMNEAENNVEQMKPQMSKFSTRGRAQQPMGDLSSKTGVSVGNGITETQGLDFGQMQNTIKPGSGTRMMSSVTTGDGSGTANVGTGKSANGRSRQYKVLVLDGDHELIRGLKLPGMKSNFGDSGEV